MRFSYRCWNKFQRYSGKSLIKYIFAFGLCFYMLLSRRSNESKVDLPQASPDLIQVRDNILQLILWPSVDEFPSLIEQTKRNLSLLNFQTGKWPDLNYIPDRLENWDLSEHLLRLRTMTLVYSSPFGLKPNEKLREAIHLCLRTWLKHDWQRPGWWWHRAQDSIVASEIFLMLGSNELSDQEIDGIVDVEIRMSRSIKYLTSHYDFIWAIQSRIYISLARSNDEELDRNMKLLWKRVRLQRRMTPGIQMDLSISSSSFLFLKPIFADKWTQTVLQMILTTNGTKYSIETNAKETFARYLVERDAWMTSGPVWIWGILGETNIRGLNHFFPHLLSSRHVRLFANYVQTESYLLSLRDYADRLDNNLDATSLVGNRHYFIENVHVHRRMNWIASLKLHFNQRKDLRCFNDENSRNTHIEDGVLYLSTYEGQYNRKEDYQTIFKLLGRKDIRGFRNDRYISTMACSKNQTITFLPEMIGGVSDQMYGVAWMGTPIDEILTKRSWHFYDDYIVVFGNGLIIPSKKPLQTTLASLILPGEETREGQITIQWSNGTQTELKRGDYQFVRSENRVLWFHAATTTWIILEDYDLLTFSYQNWTNQTSKVGPWNFRMHDRIFNAKLVRFHREGEVLFHYRYLILPNVTVKSTSKIWKESRTIVNDAQVLTTLGKTSNSTLFIHGTCDATLQRATAVVFRKPSRYSPNAYYNCSSLSLSLYIKQGGGVLFKEDADTFTITASQPIVNTKHFIIDVNRASVTSNMCTRTLRWGTQSGTRVTMKMPQSDELRGKSISVTCKKKLTGK